MDNDIDNELLDELNQLEAEMFSNELETLEPVMIGNEYEAHVFANEMEDVEIGKVRQLVTRD